MSGRAKDGASLGELLEMAIPLCRAAQQASPRTGPGRPPKYENWQMAALIMAAALKERKSKSSQYRFLQQHERELCQQLKLQRLPTRSVYFARYRRAWELFQKAITLQGRQAIAEGVAHARTVAADKSLVAARGPVWHRHQRQCGQRPVGVDDQASWGYSPHHQWVYGYSYHVVVTATPGQLVFPLLASADGGSCNEQKILALQIPDLPPQVLNLLTDRGYDSNELGEAVEFDAQGHRTGRHYLCPLQSRGNRPAVGQLVRRGQREQHRIRRAERQAFYRSTPGRKLYRQRGKTVEPFNQWLKNLFGLTERAWHRGMDNNRTMLLAAIFGYQILVRYAHQHGRRDGQIQWILDGL